jgi:NNP family nitrate/nitrite transporter-like MFS transporter
MSALLITGLRLFYKEYVLTPRGKDMNPELGPVVAASPNRKLTYLSYCGNEIFELVRTRDLEQSGHWVIVTQLVFLNELSAVQIQETSLAFNTSEPPNRPSQTGYDRLGPAAFSIIFISCLFYCNFLGRIVLGPLLLDIEADLKLSHAQASRLFLMMAGGYSVSLLCSGFISAHIIHRRMVTIAGLAAGIALIWLSLTKAVLGVQAGMVFLGLAAGLYLPSAMPCLTSLVIQPLWGRVMGLHELAPNLGFITAPLLAHWVAPLLGWRGLLGTVGLASITISMVHYWGGKGGDYHGSAPSPHRIVSLLKQTNILLIMGIQIIAVSSQFGIYSLAPAFLMDEHQMEALVAQSLLSIARLAPLGTTLLAGWLVDRWGLKKSVSIFCIVGGTFTIIQGLGPTSWQYALVFLQPLAPACLFPACFVLMSKAVTPDLRNISVGLVVPVGFFIGAGLAPAVLGYLGDHGAFGLGFAGVGAFSFLGIFFARRLKFDS